MQFNLLWKKCT